MDPFPNTGVPSASIHPCKHAGVMKKLIGLAETSGKPINVERCCLPCLWVGGLCWSGLRSMVWGGTLMMCHRPCSYLVLFLKFIASVIPTIE